MASPARAAAPSPGSTARYAAATSPDDIWTLGEQVVTPGNGVILQHES